MSILSLLGIGAVAQSLKKANTLFREGSFLEAKSEYELIASERPKDYHAIIQLGYISLLQNKLSEAEEWLIKANSIKTNSSSINNLLADTYYRKNELSKAVPYFRATGRESMALKLESFREVTPYQLADSFDVEKVKCIVTNPLPIIKVRINNKSEGNFIIDTGGGEIILDERIAKEAGAEFFGKPESGDFGGGQAGSISQGKVLNVEIGSLKIHHVPVNILALNHIVLANMKIDGVIGTRLLNQFLSSIDYKNGQLILRNRSKHSIAALVEKSPNPSIIPFYMAGDHYMLAQGSVNNSDLMLLFIDTGLGGISFTCPKSTIRKAQIPLDKSNKSMALGGGGSYETHPLAIEKLCLGNLCINNLLGLYGPFPATLENSFGFRIGGLLSHEFFLGKILTIDFEGMKYLISE